MAKSTAEAGMPPDFELLIRQHGEMGTGYFSGAATGGSVATGKPACPFFLLAEQ
jgi:hypothetical protein